MSPEPPKRGNGSSSPLDLVEGKSHHQAGRFTEAERLYTQALSNPIFVGEASRLLGVLYLQQKIPEKALPMLQSALTVNTKNADLYNYVGIAFGSLSRLDEAIMSFKQALAINPVHSDALNNLGKILHENGRPSEAVAFFLRALKQKPTALPAILGLSAALWQCGQEREAQEKLEEALRALPGNPEVLMALGELSASRGQPLPSLEFYDRALAGRPYDPEILYRRSFPLLTIGRYREGFADYDAGFGHAHLRGPNIFEPAKPWTGAPDPTKHLIVWTEQGLGDSLQFVRYAKLCRERVGKVSVLCFHQKPLVRLFKSLNFVDDAFDVIPEGARFDEHVPMMSLPHIFATERGSVPQEVPYLMTSIEIEEKWRSRFDAVVLPKVGLVWAGGSHSLNPRARAMDAERSILLAHIRSWVNIDEIKFYSLQKDRGAEQIAALKLGSRIVDYMDEVEDFADTAAIINNLDLVISVDTSVAHLAGGLGVPVWILSRARGDWRWLENARQNPWYPTARIFGQATKGDWSPVIDEVREALLREISKREEVVRK